MQGGGGTRTQLSPTDRLPRSAKDPSGKIGCTNLVTGGGPRRILGGPRGCWVYKFGDPGWPTEYPGDPRTGWAYKFGDPGASAEGPPEGQLILLYRDWACMLPGNT